MKIEGQVRIPSGCAIAAMISKAGNRVSGETITNAMKPMHDRSNGLGGGFAGYGIYPEYKEFYAFHMFFDSRAARKECEVFLKERFEIVQSEIIPTRKIPEITDEPIIWRYFVAPLKSLLTSMQLDEKEYVVRTVMKINTEMPGAYVFSSGKNMGTFKAVGYPEDIGVFYKLDEYQGYSGLPTDVILPIPPAGGEEHTPLLFWILQLYITEKFLPMMPTAGLWKCLDINVPFRRIRKSLPIF